MIKKENIFLVFLSLLLLILSVEIMMRLAGYALLTTQEQRNKEGMQTQNSKIILCIGESTTALWGEDAYPNQLQGILNARFPDKEYTVINKGISAITTSQILKKLPIWLSNYKPDIVVVMMGINDEHELLSFHSDWIKYPIFSFITNMRTYKLYKWLKFSLSKKIAQNKTNKTGSIIVREDTGILDEFSDEADFNKFFEENFSGLDESAESEYFLISQRNSRKIPKEKFLMYIQAKKYNDNEKYEEAEKILMSLMKDTKLNGLENFVYKEWLLCLAEQEKHEALQASLKDLFEKELSLVYMLSRLHELCEDDELAQVITPFLHRIKKGSKNTHYLYDLMATCHAHLGDIEKSDFYKNKSDQIKLNFYAPVVKENYLKLAKALHEKNIQLVVMQYPLRSIVTLKWMMKDAPNADHIMYIENLDNFQAALKENSYDNIFLDRFAGNFGHSNRKGNKIIAENLANRLGNYF